MDRVECTVSLSMLSFNVIVGLYQRIIGIPPIAFFDNSGIYSIYLSIFAILSVGVILNNFHYHLFLFFWHLAYCLLVIIVLSLTLSRTAILVLFIGVCIQFLTTSFVKKRLSILIKKRSVFLIILTLTFFIAIFTCTKLYFLKKNSADGRILIWKTSLMAFYDKPIFGHGVNNFQVARARVQSEYFNNSDHSVEEERLADTLEFAFNDYIQTAVETGIIGLLLFIALTVKILILNQNNRFNNIIKSALIGMFVSFLFTYSLQRIELLSLFFLLLVLISINEKPLLTFKVSFLIRRVTICGFLLFAIIISAHSLILSKSHYKWKKVYDKYLQKNDNMVSIYYQKLYPTLSSNPYFLYNYAAIMNRTYQFQKSAKLANECKKHLYDSDVLVLLGDNYASLDNLALAEIYYQEACRLLPHKFIPRYKLALVYYETGQIDKAKKLAQQVIVDSPKIPSKEIDQIKMELIKLILNN